ncbi:MAG: hypothetical protein PVF56_22985 [Desulfobacterales bacterium]|jgi:hypothetical protein
MRDESSQNNYNPNDSKKCVPLERCKADCNFQAAKPRLRVLITDSQEGVGGVVAAILREEFQQTFDLRVFFTRCATEIIKAADEHCFDLFILNVDVIHFPSRLNFISALEFRKKKSLEVVHRISRNNNSPVIVLYAWGDPVFEKNIAGARYDFELPCSVYELREAIRQCVG